jgi:hypothetical protein
MNTKSNTSTERARLRYAIQVQKELDYDMLFRKMNEIILEALIFFLKKEIRIS